MQWSHPPHQALDRIIEAYRKGFCDKLRALGMVAELHRGLSDQDAAELRTALFGLFRNSDMTSEHLPGHIVNVAGLALSCLCDIAPTQHLPEFVFHRLHGCDAARMDIWANELLPELQWGLMRSPERFGAEALNNIKAFAVLVRSKPQAYTPSVVSAVDGLERTAEYVEFERFANKLSGKGAGIQTAAASLENLPPIAGLDSMVAGALSEAERRLTTQGEFDPKTAADLVRGAMDEAHRKIVAELERIHRKPYTGGDKDGGRRAYMRSVGFITQPEEEFFSGIYSLISKEASHKLLAPRETVLLLHRTVSNYLVLLMERLNKTRAEQLHVKPAVRVAGS